MMNHIHHTIGALGAATLMLLLGGCAGKSTQSAESEPGTASEIESDREAIVSSSPAAPFEEATEQDEKSESFHSQPIPKEIQERMKGRSLPDTYDSSIIRIEDLRYLNLLHIDFEGQERRGEMICHQSIADDLLDIFRQLYEARYPIRSIRLIDDFGGSDEASMEADNSSCFNYRSIAGSVRLSKHAQGLAVDINPLENPCVRHGRVEPVLGAAYADRSYKFEHKIGHQDLCYRLFIAKGFHWGGDWRSLKDYQHFEK